MSINTVQSEVSVGSKYWILSGLAVIQSSSVKILKQAKILKTVTSLTLYAHNATKNKLYKKKKGKHCIVEF